MKVTGRWGVYTENLIRIDGVAGGMIGLLGLFLAFVVAPFKLKSRLEVENAALRHQLIVLRRTVHGRVRLTNNDRWFFIQLYRWFPSILQALRSFSPRRLCVGIGLAFVGTGVGSRARN